MSLPVEQAEAIEALVASGEYANAGEVKRAALDAPSMPRAGDPAIERWPREEVLPTYDEMVAHPEHGILAEVVEADLNAWHAEATKRGARGMIPTR